MLLAVVTTGHFSEAHIPRGKNSTGIQSCHEPPDWDPSQAGNTDVFIPPITGLWCDADSAACSQAKVLFFMASILSY